MIALYKLDKGLEEKLSSLLDGFDQTIGYFHSIKAILDKMMNPFVVITTEPYCEELESLSLPVVCLSIDLHDVRRKIASLEDGVKSIKQIAVVCTTEKEKRWLEKEYALEEPHDRMSYRFLVREELKEVRNHTVYFAPIWEQIFFRDQPVKREIYYVEPSLATLRRSLQQACSLLNFTRERVREKYQMEAVVDSAHDGVIAVDRNNRITLVNEHAKMLLGLQGDVVGRSITDFIPNSDMLRVLRTGRKEIGDVATVLDRPIVINRFPVIVKDQVVGAVSNFKEIIDIQKMEMTLRKKLHQDGLEARYPLSSIVGSSPEITGTKEQAVLFAKTNAPVLITGESGTGKELFAQGIHLESGRALGPFLAVNCAALPESLLESELFGYEEGTFTGAKKGGKPGLFELAHGGTIFLDEIGEMPLRIQAMLLRVLQEKRVRRIGGARNIPVDVRIIAATNRNLDAEMNQERFRKDLYYRINLLTLELPPLRDRLADIPELVKSMVKELNEEREHKIEQISHDVYTIFKEYNWAGNVRQLRNVIERMVLLAKGSELTKEDAMFLLRNRNISSHLLHQEADAEKDQVEIQNILTALQEAKYNKTLAAKALGINRSTLWRKIKQHGLE